MDSELIEKARLAFVEAWEARSAEDGPREPGDRSRAGIRAALAVFEAAQKPIRCDYCGDALPSVTSRAHIPTTPDLQRMGFDADKIVCPECVARVRAAQKPTDDEREALARALNRDARRIRESRDRAGIEFGSMTVPIDVMLKLTESAPSLEPQTEPTDAQVRAAWDSLGPSVTIHLEYEQLIAALRAAAETTNREDGGDHA